MNPSTELAPLVEVFTGQYCSYCHRAKALLERKGVKYLELSVSDASNRAAMVARVPSAKTVPQVFVAGRHLGGFDDLNRLDLQGELDRLLALAGE